MNYQTNGCGACKGFWSFLNPLLPQKNFFKDVCDIHDVDYEIGGTEKERFKADLNFLYSMRYKIKTHFYKRKFFSKVWYLIIAESYYYAVRLFGQSNFNYK